MKANMLASMLAGIIFIIITVIGTTLKDVVVPLPSNMIKALIEMSSTP
jgi:predicted benzoate:H+ symporter BenE